VKIGIIGAGAIGLLMASYLAEQHHITLYVRRNEQKNQLQSHGISLYHSDQYMGTTPITVRHISALENEECYIICVKQTHMLDIMPYIKHIHGRPILFLQNGMGHLSLLDSLSSPLLVGVVEHGVKRQDDVTVNHLGKGTIRIAPYHSTIIETQRLHGALDHKKFPFDMQDNYKVMLTDKLIVNAVINPLTALFRVQNGSIIENKPIRTIAEMLCQEASEALHMDYEVAWKRVKQTALATKENTSSMYADILAGRKTEIDSISGYIMEQAKKELPYTTFTYQAILALEKRG